MRSESAFRTFLTKLRKRQIIETFAGFIAGGWLVLEFVDRILIAHYHINEKWLDVAFFTLLGGLLCVILWRWFGGTEKRPGNVKIEVLLVPLIILLTIAIDLNLILRIAGVQGKKLLIGIVSLCLGIAWVIFKALQWAAAIPESAKKEVDVSSPVAAKPEKSIVVLPFVDMSPQKDQEYFCDGMTEELINRLSNIRDLKVPARTSAFMFKGKTPKMHDVGEMLKVQTALEGSVQKSGDRLRITAQLVNISDGYHLWSEKYDRELKDVFAIQDEIASAIVEALRLKLTFQEKQRIAKHPIDNIAAYECYLRANHEIWRFTKESIDLAVQYLQNALNTIGDNATLFSGLAMAHFQYVNIGAEREDGLNKAEEYVKKTLALEPDSPKAHSVLGLICSMFRGSQKEGVRNLKHALAVNPDDSDALLDLAVIYIYYIGKMAEAWPLIERLIRVDPLNQSTVIVQGALDFYDGRYVPALEAFSKAYQMDANNPWVQFSYSWALAYNERFEEAFTIVEQAVRNDPNNTFTKFGVLLKSALQRDKEKAFREMTPEFAWISKRDAFASYCVSVAMALLRENKEAMDWLENAVDRGFLNYPMLAERDPFLANIRGEPRFQKLMERVKYEWEHFEV